MKPFVHLHTHSQYSLLNGAMSMKDLLKRVGEYGMSSVAITDEHNMFGAVDFQLKAKAQLGQSLALRLNLYVLVGKSQAIMMIASCCWLGSGGYGNEGLVAWATWTGYSMGLPQTWRC